MNKVLVNDPWPMTDLARYGRDINDDEDLGAMSQTGVAACICVGLLREAANGALVVDAPGIGRLSDELQEHLRPDKDDITANICAVGIVRMQSDDPDVRRSGRVMWASSIHIPGTDPASVRLQRGIVPIHRSETRNHAHLGIDILLASCNLSTKLEPAAILRYLNMVDGFRGVLPRTLTMMANSLEN